MIYNTHRKNHSVCSQHVFVCLQTRDANLSFRFRKVLTNDSTWKISPTPQSHVSTREIRMAPLIHLVSVFDPTARTLMGTRASGLLRYADVGTLPREVHGSMHAQFATLVGPP